MFKENDGTVLSKHDLIALLRKGHVKQFNSYRRAHPGYIDLSKADLSDASTLCFADFTELNLAGINLTRVYLAKVKFTGSDLTGACMREAVLSGADLSNTKLTNAVFDGAYLAGVDYRYATLSHSQLDQFERANRKGVSFID